VTPVVLSSRDGGGQTTGCLIEIHAPISSSGGIDTQRSVMDHHEDKKTSSMASAKS
jgi:hypothetical protein